MEQEGVDYFFVDRDKFFSQHFLETTEYLGEWYGTSLDHIHQLEHEGYTHIILNLDDVGVSKIKNIMPDVVSILILPPSAAELYRRLDQRESETPLQIEDRMRKSYAQLKNICLNDYDYVIVNDDLAHVSQHIVDIISTTNPPQSLKEKQDLVNYVCATFKEFR